MLDIWLIYAQYVVKNKGDIMIWRFPARHGDTPIR